MHEEKSTVREFNQVRLFAFAVLERDRRHRCAPAQRTAAVAATVAQECADRHVVLHVHAASGQMTAAQAHYSDDSAVAQRVNPRHYTVEVILLRDKIGSPAPSLAKVMTDFDSGEIAVRICGQ